MDGREDGRSKEEEEAREILQEVVTRPAAARNLAAASRSRVAALDGVELDLPPRDPMREPPYLPGKQG